MSGIHTDKKKLNHTLEFVANVLHEENINDWFIFFGTLLGIVRENSCIDQDDDLDIMINCDYQQLRNAFEKRGFDFGGRGPGGHRIKNPGSILKSKPTQEFASFDFYMCEVKLKNYFSKWQNVEIQNVEIDSKEWRSTQINLPKNSEYVLKKLYGETWQTPIKYEQKDKQIFAKGAGFYNPSIYTLI